MGLLLSLSSLVLVPVPGGQRSHLLVLFTNIFYENVLFSRKMEPYQVNLLALQSVEVIPTFFFDENNL